MGIKNISQKLTSQVFFLTHFLSWNGITGKGLDVICKYGYLMSYRTYLNHCSVFEKKYNTYIKNVVTSDKKKVYWIDNFNKVQKHSLKRDITVSDLNWTGIGISLPLGDFRYDILNTKRCLPIDLLKKEYLKHLYEKFLKVFDGDPEFFSYYPNSLLIKNNILTSNLKPLTPSISFSEQDIRNMKELKCGWKIYKPYELLDMDIGTKIGLGKVIEWLTEVHSGEIMHIIVDENIFYRMLKVSTFIISIHILFF